MRYCLFPLFLISLLTHPTSIVVADDADLKGLHDRWSGAMKTLRIPGLAVVAVKGDEVILIDTLGIRDPQGAKPVTPDTYFYIASCTKPYTAAVAARLAEEGKLHLDAPVRKYLPRFKLADESAAERMTVRDLMCHRPGLGMFPVVFLDAYTGEITDDRFFHFLQNARPRGQTSYSNVHFTLLGRVIEAVEGKGWREALDERLFKPAGMTRTTGYASRMYGDADAALPLEEKNEGWIPCTLRKTDRTMHAAGGLGSTARDLGRWLRLNLNGGNIDGQQVLATKTLQEMFKLQSTSKRNFQHPELKAEGFGLGWVVGTYRGHRMMSHGGGYTGTAAHISFLPERQMGVAVLANTDGPAAALVELAALDVYDRLLGITSGPDLMPKLFERAQNYFKQRQDTPPAPPAPAVGKGLSLPAAEYVATFQNEHWGTLTIKATDGKLEAAHGDLPIPLKSTGTDTFQFAIDPRTWRNGRFEVKNGKLQAVVLVWNDAGEARFTRK
jgi:CubicO group peptidase (beta-lactamase class C family)